MSPLRSFGLSIVSLITLIVPAQVFAQDNATIAQELATELVTSVTKAMAMTVIGPLDDQRLALTDLGANKFQVTVAASTFLGQPLPEMVFIAQKAVGGLWVISQGRTKAPIKIKTGEDGLEIAVKELSWMGTWDSKNSEYIAISVSLTELEVTHPNLHLSVEYFKHTVGDRDKMTGEFLTGLYITDLAYQISLGAEAE